MRRASLRLRAVSGSRRGPTVWEQIDRMLLEHQAEFTRVRKLLKKRGLKGPSIDLYGRWRCDDLLGPVTARSGRQLLEQVGIDDERARAAR